MVLNGVSRRSLAHVEQAERVCVGRCRAIVRVPWDDQLNGQAVKRTHPPAPGGRAEQRWAGRLSPATAAATPPWPACLSPPWPAAPRPSPASRSRPAKGRDIDERADGQEEPPVGAVLRRPDPAHRDARLGVLQGGVPELRFVVFREARKSATSGSGPCSWARSAARACATASARSRGSPESGTARSDGRRASPALAGRCIAPRTRSPCPAARDDATGTRSARAHEPCF